jgi:hypothetical protein
MVQKKKQKREMRRGLGQRRVDQRPAVQRPGKTAAERGVAHRQQRGTNDLQGSVEQRGEERAERREKKRRWERQSARRRERRRRRKRRRTKRQPLLSLCDGAHLHCAQRIDAQW